MQKRTKKNRPSCLLIPGMGEKPTDPAYRKLRAHILREGWKVVVVDVRWRRRTLTDWIAQVRTSAAETELDLVVGFSFGALLALLLASELRPRKIIAASPSPYFREQIKLLPPLAEKILGKTRMTDFKQYGLQRMRGVAPTAVTILVAEHDFPLLKSTAPTIKELIGSTATLETVPEAFHDIGDRNYYLACKTEVTRAKIGR